MSIRKLAAVVVILLSSALLFAQDDTRKFWKHGEGSFKHLGGKEWLETADSGGEFEWTEKERTKQAIKLYDAKRKVYISLGATSAVVTAGGNKTTYKGAWTEAPAPRVEVKKAPAQDKKLAPLTREEQKILEWINHVTMRATFGGERSGTRRWMRAPTLSIMKASTSQAGPIAAAVKEVNETLAKTPLKAIKLIEPDNSKADILVYYAPREQLVKLAKSHDFELLEGPLSVTTLQDPKFELQRGFVFIDSEKVTGDEILRNDSIWVILGAIGFQRSSPDFPESIFAGSRDYADMDRKLVVFFYNYVPPMTEDREMRKLFQKHWPK
jgi:hypothetical protein